MKKSLLMLLCLLLGTELVAAPRMMRHRRFHGRPCRIPWQTIVAGGAAVSGIVLAYKIGNGFEQGAIESAKSAPERFIDKFGGVGDTLRTACAIIAIIGIVYACKLRIPYACLKKT